MKKARKPRLSGAVLWGGAFLLLAVALPNSSRLVAWFNQARPDLNEPDADPNGTMLLALLPFAFVENQGQWHPNVKFQGRKLGFAVGLEPGAITLECSQRHWRNFKGAVVRLVFENSSPDKAELEAEGKLPGKHHYFLGSRPHQWHTGISGYRRVRYDNLYQHIDLRVQEQRDRLEYDWVLEPGADLTQVVIRVEGAKTLELAEDGSLRMHTAVGPVVQMAPNAWYELNTGRKRLVKARFAMRGEGRYGFEVPNRDPNLALVIDPGIDATEFLHVAAAERPVVSTEAGTTSVIAGRARSPGVPHKSQVFVTRMNPADNSLVYTTYLAGNADAIAHSVVADSSGDVDVGGWTNSLNFPTLPAASKPGVSNFFVVWLNPSGGVQMFSKQVVLPPDEEAAAPDESTPSIVPPALEEAPAMTVPTPAGPAHPLRVTLTITPYGASSPAACDPLHLGVSDTPGGDKLIAVSGIPEDAGALIVVSQSERSKKILGSTVLIARSEMLMSMPMLTDSALGKAELPLLSLLRNLMTPGRTVYIQAFSSGCSFTAPFRASNALAVRAD